MYHQMALRKEWLHSDQQGNGLTRDWAHPTNPEYPSRQSLYQNSQILQRSRALSRRRRRIKELDERNNFTIVILGDMVLIKPSNRLVFIVDLFELN